MCYATGRTLRIDILPANSSDNPDLGLSKNINELYVKIWRQKSAGEGNLPPLELSIILIWRSWSNINRNIYKDYTHIRVYIGNIFVLSLF